MLRTWMVVGIVSSFIGSVFAQDSVTAPRTVRDGVVPERRIAAAEVGADDASYVIEMRVLEGAGLRLGLPQGALGLKKKVGDLVRAGEVLGELEGEKAPESTTTPAARPPAPLPNLLQRNVLLAQAAKSPGEEVWDDVLQVAGITVLAEPLVALVANTSATVVIQTQQVLSYLAPLGDGKFEVKRTAQQELGMKFTFEVQPVAGDPESIDLAPLEIQVSALDGREAVEGLGFDVGKPIIATRSLKTTARMKLGETRVIAIPSGPNTEAVLVVRVKRMDQPWSPETGKATTGGRPGK